ncbi:MAG: FlgD immunoglobulin-like domain containing protein [candidate division KSB1 bacterium]
MNRGICRRFKRMVVLGSFFLAGYGIVPALAQEAARNAPVEDCKDCSLNSVSQPMAETTSPRATAIAAGTIARVSSSTKNASEKLPSNAPNVGVAQTADLVADRVYLRTGPNSGEPDVANPIAGQQYFVHIDFRNTGATAANGYLLQIKLNGSVLCSGNFTTSGNTSEVAWCTTALTWPSGNNTIAGVLDVNNIITETNENNNSISRSYSAAAELIAERVYLRTGQNSGDFVSVPLPGQSYFAHFDWRNAGSNSANNFRLEIRLNGGVLCFNNGQNAGANTLTTTWCNTAVTWPSGEVVLEGVLDANSAISETIENDNAAARFFGFQTYRDFELTAQVRSAENFTNNPGADLAFIYGYQDEQHYYYVMLNRTANDSRVYKIRGTSRTEIGTLGTFVIPDTNYHEVKLRRTGSIMQVFFDGVSLGTAVDAEYDLGGVGLGSFNDAAMWDNVCIRRITGGNCDFLDDFEDLNADDWIPLHASRWQVVAHQGDRSYFLKTSNFENQFNLRLGEYSLLSSQIELVADEIFLRTGPNSGNVVENPVAGVPYFLHFGWRNTGRAPALGFRFQLRALGRDTCEYNGNAEAYSAHNSWCSDPVAFNAGTATLEGALDFRNVLFEHKKTNNVLRRTLTVTAPAVDLIADRVYLRTGQNSGDIVTNPVAGVPYFVHLDWRNAGAAVSGFRIELRHNGVVLCSFNNQNAGANTSAITWCANAVTFAPGTQTLTGVLDVNNVVAETNENNNTASQTLTATAPTTCNPQACSGPAIFPVKEGGTVAGEVITGTNGAIVCVEVRIRQNPSPIDAFGFTVKVDPTRLAFVSASAGNLTSGFVSVNAQEVPANSGTINCGGFGATPIPTNSAGVVIKLCFRVLCPAPSLPPAPIEILNPIDDVSTMSVCCNLFNCSGCVSNGDVDNNGAISPGDAQCAFQIFLNGGTLPAACNVPNFTCEVAAADVTCDGTVSPGDALAIFNRYLAGLPPAACFGRTNLAKADAAYQLSLMQRLVLNAPEAGGKDLVKVALAVKNPSGLQAFGLNLLYPTNKLTLLGVRRSAVTEKWLQLDGRSREPGVVTLGGFHDKALTANNNSELFEVWFASAGEAVSASDFVIDNLVDDFGQVSREVATEATSSTPVTFKLHQNYPNPFALDTHGKATTIRFDLPGKEAARVELAIYNLSGQLVRRLISGERAPGAYEIAWDGRNEQGQLVPSGAYLFKLEAGNLVESKTLTVVR